MPVKRKTSSPVPFGMSNKQMKRKKPINTDLMKTIDPLTDNQEELFRCYKTIKTSLLMVQQVRVRHSSPSTML
jgi:hypothetical protein